MVVDVETGKELLVEAMGDISEFANIAWSPDGETVAFSGLQNGYSDIYLYNLVTKVVTQLTNDRYSDYQPRFSRDGTRIVFRTDRVSPQSDPRREDKPLRIEVL